MLENFAGTKINTALFQQANNIIGDHKAAEYRGKMKRQRKRGRERERLSVDYLLIVLAHLDDKFEQGT